MAAAGGTQTTAGAAAPAPARSPRSPAASAAAPAPTAAPTAAKRARAAPGAAAPSAKRAAPRRTAARVEVANASYIGPSHAEDPYLLPHVGDAAAKFVTRGAERVGPGAYFVTYARACDCAARRRLDTEWARLDAQIAEYRDAMLALFFKFVDWTFPAVDKRAFYEKYCRAGPDAVSRGLLCAMLGLGSAYWKYSKLLCIRAVPRGLVEGLWELARAQLDHDVACTGATLETAQALLLYTQKRTPSDAYHEQVVARATLGKLVAVAYSLGLHADCGAWAVPSSEKQLRRRLAACLYYVDAWSALLLGHPALTSMSVVFASAYPQEARFVHLVRLTRVVQPYAAALNCGLPADAAGTLEAIGAWWAQLPPELRSMEQRNELNYCSNGMLHLSGLGAEALVYRQLLAEGGHWAGATALVRRIARHVAAITHAHMHAFWLSPCTLLLSALAHFVLRVHAHSGPAERRQQQPLVKAFAGALRTLNATWEEGAHFAQERMDVLLHKGATDLVLPPVAGTPQAEYAAVDALSERGDSPFDLVDEDLDTLLQTILLNFDACYSSPTA